MAIHVESADAHVAGADAAGHDLLHRDFARYAVLLAELLHQMHEPVGTTGVERIRPLLHDQALEDALDVFDRARAIGIEHADHLAHPAEQVVSHDELGTAGGEDRGHPDAIVGRELGDRSHGGEADPAAEHDDVLAAGLERETDAQRSHDVAVLTGFERGHPAGAAADAFVEEFQALTRTIDTINTLRTAQPEVAVVG